jgi:MOSC domain-containing protein YiiM
MSKARLISINVGQARPIPGLKAKTGIYKEPVTGPVPISDQGIVGDAILDRRHHGGSDQAIYIYFQDDYDFWAGELGYATPPGLFGENLTISGTDSASTAIGDHFEIDDLLLEVTAHRTPCMTFARRMDDKFWVKRFHKARRPGAYCRVLRPASIEAGREVTIIPYAGERISVAELMSYDGSKSIPDDFMRRVVSTPVDAKTRFDYETRLSSLF